MTVTMMMMVRTMAKMIDMTFARSSRAHTRRTFPLIGERKISSGENNNKRLGVINWTKRTGGGTWAINNGAESVRMEEDRKRRGRGGGGPDGQRQREMHAPSSSSTTQNLPERKMTRDGFIRTLPSFETRELSFFLFFLFLFFSFFGFSAGALVEQVDGMMN